VRICLIASSRYPVREPFAGGLESLTHQLAAKLVGRGHEVTLFAAPGSDPDLPVTQLRVADFRASPPARADSSAAADRWMAEHHAYLALMLDLAGQGSQQYDVVHNNSLHHLPVAMASMLEVPVVTTLHTPPTPWLESAVEVAPGASSFTAVSRFTASAWRHAVDCVPILNGVDIDRWVPGPGGGPAVWSGRLVAEKAPHQAIDAAQEAGLPIVLAGPVQDPAYFDEWVAPRLGPAARYVGHLDHEALARLLASASVAVVTPVWDEPYGLVAAEAMACGTPVAAYDRGALPEFVVDGAGVLARAGDAADLARAIDEARGLDRAVVRTHATEHCSLARMVSDYEFCYAGLVHGEVVP
jgi:glycosyltransferase involved in cell wall biosynthesis